MFSCTASSEQDLPKAQVLAPRVALYLGHFLPVGLRVQGGLGEQGRMLFRGNTKLIVERVMPDLWGGGRNTMMSCRGALQTRKKYQNEPSKTRTG